MEFEYRVILTTRAEKDLNEIEEYISEELHAPIAAERFTSAVESVVNNLTFSPRGHPKVRNDRLAAQGYRWIGIKRNYVAFYTIDEQAKEVWVERILYGRRDWMRIL